MMKGDLLAKARALRQTAPSLEARDIRFFAYDLKDGSEPGFMIEGLEPSHVGDRVVEDGLRALAQFAEDRQLCIFAVLDDRASGDELSESGGHRPLGVTRLAEWLAELGFENLGGTQLGLGELAGVDHRYRPLAKPPTFM